MCVRLNSIFFARFGCVVTHTIFDMFEFADWLLFVVSIIFFFARSDAMQLFWGGNKPSALNFPGQGHVRPHEFQNLNRKNNSPWSFQDT